MTTPTDIFRDTVNSMLCNVHTSLPGIVNSYDSSTNKAVIQPALNKNFTSGEMPMPILENVPIMFPKNIVFPVNPGDYVLLIFIERSIDLWLEEGGQVTPTDPRKFDLSDAIAIPGLMPFTENFPENNNKDYVISFGDSSITIKENGDILINTSNKVAIGNSTTELLNILSQLMQLLQGSATVSVPAVPFTGPLSPAFTAQVALIQSQLDAITGVIT